MEIWFKFHILLLLLLQVVCNYNWGLILAEYNRDDFPSDFVFGSGTSAYQVEGAAFEDGRTPSIWDTFAHDGYNSPGGNGDVACDGYHKYKEDVQLMVRMGLEAFKFSISWSRLIPNGRGPINLRGLQYYNNFINELINHGIQPHVILFHSDLPQILEDEYQGWLSRKSVDDFEAYAQVCFREFGDRVKHWTTFNEANIFVVGGYDTGFMPPAHCSFPFGNRNCTTGDSSSEPYIAAHNILLAHASAASLYNLKYKGRQGYIGIDLYTTWFAPYTNSIEDKMAAQRALDFFIGWFLNPLVFGDYPEIMKKNAASRIPSFSKEESILVKGSIDFIGINHYYRMTVKDKSSNLHIHSRDFFADIGMETDEKLIMGADLFPVDPSSIEAVLNYVKNNYRNPPIYIYENGQHMKRDEELNDIRRVEYMQSFIGGVLNAIRNGSNTRGYFYWSFMDVYELLYGYNAAFGLYYVDREDKDLTRYPKFSAHWYSNFLQRNISTQHEILLQVKQSSLTSS